VDATKTVARGKLLLARGASFHATVPSRAATGQPVTSLKFFEKEKISPKIGQLKLFQIL
jgi:hypothetical protein